jgi:DNA-binding NtrC family response regulator
MDRRLNKRTVLIVQPEELSAMVLTRAFEEVGATVTASSNVKDATAMVRRGMFSVAVLDHALFHGTKELQEFEKRGVPYVLHNGLIEMHGTRRDELEVVPKPTTADALVDAVVKLLSQRRSSS